MLNLLEMVEMEIPDVSGISPAAESLDKYVRHTGNAGKMDVAVGLDVADRLVSRHEIDWLAH